MIKDLIYINRNHPHLWEFSFSNDEVFGKFDNGKSYSHPIGEFTEVLKKLQEQYDNDITWKQKNS